MIRKTDDKLILEMLKEGKTQKEIAEHFEVSPVAIHKRVKRLSPQPETPHFNNLTDKEQKFALEKAKGNTNIVAVMGSYEVTSRESAKVIGSQLMAKPGIELAIKELMNIHGLSRDYRVKRIKDHVDNPDPNVSLKALDQSWKLDGSYGPEEEKDYCTYEERNEQINKLESEIEQDLASMRMIKERLVEIWREGGVSESEIIEKLIEMHSVKKGNK